jgi:predicted P-loop ATPase
MSRMDEYCLRDVEAEALLDRELPRKPGVKMDTGLILEGRQGLKKSTVAQILAGPWFTDHVPDLRSKDAQIQLQGAWIVEFADYGNLGRADANFAKIFWSTVNDQFREPYGTVRKEHPRQCVFMVSLNKPVHGYLKDETGNRRFWPAECGLNWPKLRQIDVEDLAAERDQLWAEADHRYQQDESWWLHEPELLIAHESAVATRLDVGPWFSRVARVMRDLVKQGNTEPTFDEVCAGLGLLSTKEITRQAQVEVGRALTTLGWVGKRVTCDDSRHRLEEPGDR